MSVPPLNTYKGAPSTVAGGGFVNCFQLTDTDPAWVTLHGTGLALCGGDVWGKARSAPDALRSNAPGGLRVWQGAKGHAKGFQICGFTFSYVQAGRCYAFHGTGDPSVPTASNGFICYSDDGLTWTEISTENSPSNFQHNHPRGVGNTMLARSVSSGTKDQIIVAGADGLYVSQDVTAGTSNAGMSKVALGDLSGAFSGLACVGLARDPNSADTIYVAARAAIGSTTLAPGLWKVTVNSSGAASNATKLVSMNAQEVFAVAETGGTAVYVVGKGGVIRYKNGATTNISGGIPTTSTWCSVHGFNLSGFTTLVVGCASDGTPGKQLYWARFADSGASPSWTSIDSGTRLPANFPVYGMSGNYWGFTGAGGKKGAFALGSGGSFVASQIIVLPHGSNSADIYVCGRTTQYMILDVATSSNQWQVTAFGTNGSVGKVTVASPAGGGKMAHGDLDFLITTSEDGYSTNQPRLNGPVNAYFYALSYDELGGLYAGSSPGPTQSVTTGGRISYHPAPHDTTNYNGTSSWMVWSAPGAGNRVLGVFGTWSSGQRILLCTVYKDQTYRRVDTVSGRDAQGNPTGFNTGTWKVVPNLAVGVANGSVNFLRGGSNSIYCLDPKRGLCRSDDLGVSFSVIDGSLSGAGNAIDNDWASNPDRIAATAGAGVVFIENARTAPGTKSTILSAAKAPNVGGIAFDRDTTYRTTGSPNRGRLYVFNNAGAGSNPSFYYSDDHATFSPSQGGPTLGTTTHGINDMSASNGHIVMTSDAGGVMSIHAISTVVDVTAPTPNPPNATGITTPVAAIGPNTVRLAINPCSDAGSGVDRYEWSVATTIGGTYNVIGTLPAETGVLTDAVHIPANTSGLYAKVRCFDANGNVTSLSTALGPFTTPVSGAAPNMVIASLAVLDPAQPLLVTMDLTGSDPFDSGVITWGDGATNTINAGVLQYTHLYGGEVTNISVSVTGTNSFGTTTPAVSTTLTISLGSLDTGTPAFLDYVVPGQTTQDVYWPIYNANLDQVNAMLAVHAAQILTLQQQVVTLGGGTGSATAWTTPWATGADTGTGTSTTMTATLPSVDTSGKAITSGLAFCVVAAKAGTSDNPAVTDSNSGTHPWVLQNSPGIANSNGSDTMFIYKKTMGAADAGLTVTVTATNVLHCCAIVGTPEAATVDAQGVLQVANSGTTASGSQATPTNTTPLANELVLFFTTGRFTASSGRAVNTPAAVPGTLFPLWTGNTNQSGQNNMFVAAWAVLQPTAGAVSAQASTTSTNAFSIGAAIGLVHV